MNANTPYVIRLAQLDASEGHLPRPSSEFDTKEFYNEYIYTYIMIKAGHDAKCGISSNLFFLTPEQQADYQRAFTFIQDCHAEL